MRSEKNSCMSFCSPVLSGWLSMMYILQKLLGLYALRSLSCTPTVLGIHGCLTMEVEAIPHATQWLASQHDAQITHAIILTDSMNLLQKVESGTGCPGWHRAMQSSATKTSVGICCPGHVRISGNERADRLARIADITSGLQLGRAEVLRGLRNFLNLDRPEHQSPEGKRSGERKRPTFHPPRLRTICVQPDKYWHCFEGNLGWIFSY